MMSVNHAKGEVLCSKDSLHESRGRVDILIDWGVVTLGNGVYMEGVFLELFK